MGTEDQIDAYISAQPGPRREEMRELHRLIQHISPQAELWFLDGKNEEGKIISNPNIGYGNQTICYASGKTRPFYKIGVSANTGGISIYIIGIENKKFLADTYGAKLGKASITGYCIKFKSLTDLDTDVLEDVIRFGLGERKEG